MAARIVAGVRSEQGYVERIFLARGLRQFIYKNAGERIHERKSSESFGL